MSNRKYYNNVKNSNFSGKYMSDHYTILFLPFFCRFEVFQIKKFRVKKL